MITGMSLFLVAILIVVLLVAFWRFDSAVDGEETGEGTEDAEDDRVVKQVAAAQRLRREAAETSDPEERARLIRFADEADGTAEKIRQGVLSDQ